jgi:hypothetical protein
MRSFVKVVRVGAMCAAMLLACTPAATAQLLNAGGTWLTAGGNAQLTGQQPDEAFLNASTVSQIKQIWKMPLRDAYGAAPTEPLVIGKPLLESGFKDVALVLAPGNNVYAVDYPLGQPMWQRHFDVYQAGAAACPNAQLTVITAPPPRVFSFGRRGAPGAAGRGAAGRGRAEGGRGRGVPGVSGPPQLSLSGGGGGFALPVFYVVLPTGMVQEVRASNGTDFGDPVRLVNFRNSAVGGSVIANNKLYVTVTGDCGGQMQPDGTWQYEPNSVYSLGAEGGKYPVTAYAADANLSAAAVSTDGQTLYVVSGAGKGAHANSVLALDAGALTLKDYYTPAAAAAREQIDVAPTVFADGGHDYVAAYSTGGRLVLLDAAALGGADHHTPLAQSAPLTEGGGRAWGRLATAEVNGTRWILVSVHGRPNPALHLASNGAAANGAVVAFKLEHNGGQPALVPAWASANLVDPSPAVIANSLAFSLANGSPATHARLVALNLTTGATVYNSGDQIGDHADNASLALANGQLLFVTADNTLYNFGHTEPHGVHNY